MVLHKRDAELYAGVETLVREHLGEKEGLLKASLHEGNFLSCLKTIYRDHEHTMIRIRDILLYMDRSTNRKPIYDLGLEIFDEQLLSKVSVYFPFLFCFL